MDYLSLRREFVELLPSLSGEELKVYLALVQRDQQQRSMRLGLTLQELSRVSDVGVGGVAHALDRLQVVGDPPLLKKEEGKTSHRLFVPLYWTGQQTEHAIPFTYKNTDDTKVANVEKELRRVQLQQDRKTESELRHVVQGEARDLIIEIERRQGRGLDILDAWFLSNAVRGYGPERVRQTYRRMQSQKNPIRATIASLGKGIVGKGAEERETVTKEVRYKELD